MYWFDEPEPGCYEFVPETDILTSCQKHMATICILIHEVYMDFGQVVDPGQIYTPEGLKNSDCLEAIPALNGPMPTNSRSLPLA